MDKRRDSDGREMIVIVPEGMRLSAEVRISCNLAVSAGGGGATPASVRLSTSLHCGRLSALPTCPRETSRERLKTLLARSKRRDCSTGSIWIISI